MIRNRAPESSERVLMTLDPLGGVFPYALGLARQFAGRGAEVLLASMGGALSKDQRDALGRVPGVTAVATDFALEWMDDPWADVDRASGWLLGLEQDFGPSVVHLNGYSHAAAGFRAPVVVVAHSCVASWWRAVLGEAAPPRYDEYRARVRRGLLSATAVVAPTEAMLRALVFEYGGDLPHTLVIHNGAPRDVFVPAAKEPFVLASGRLWDRAKNLSDVAAIAGELRWPLRLAGESVAPNGTTFEPPPNVEMLGRLSRESIAREMGRASVFLHPALYEPFGLAPLEAALAGCALVLSDIPSLREIWGDAALFVPPKDARALVRAVNRVARDDALRFRLQGAARRRALSYSEAAAADAYLALYRALVHEAPAAARAAGWKPDRVA